MFPNETVFWGLVMHSGVGQGTKDCSILTGRSMDYDQRHSWNEAQIYKDDLASQISLLFSVVLGHVPNVLFLGDMTAGLQLHLSLIYPRTRFMASVGKALLKQ